MGNYIIHPNETGRGYLYHFRCLYMVYYRRLTEMGF